MSKRHDENKPSAKPASKAPSAASKVKSPTERVVPATLRRKHRYSIDGDARQSMIAEAAYYRAERRNFADGGAFDDWLEAEHQIDHMLDRDSTR